MAIKYIRFALLVIYVTTVFATCRKNCTDTTYSFNITAKVYPNTDSIRIGDTLWLEVITPTTLSDSSSGKTIDYSNAENMGIAIQMLSFHGGSVSDPGSSYVLDSFDYIIEAGSLYTSTQYANNYLFNESNNLYSFKLGIIAERIGTYALAISDAVNVYRRNNKCTKAFFSIKYLPNTDQHLYIYQNSRPSYEISSYESTHLYCFKVY